MADELLRVCAAMSETVQLMEHQKADMSQPAQLMVQPCSPCSVSNEARSRAATSVHVYRLPGTGRGGGPHRRQAHEDHRPAADGGGLPLPGALLFHWSRLRSPHLSPDDVATREHAHDAVLILEPIVAATNLLVVRIACSMGTEQGLLWCVATIGGAGGGDDLDRQLHDA